jgi:hypothetical protein
MNDDIVNSLTLLREALRSTIMIQEGLIRAIEKMQSQLIHSYELTKRVAPNCYSDPLEIVLPEDP